MQRQRKHLALTLSIVAVVVSAVFAGALIANATGQVAKDCPVGASNSNPALVWDRAYGGKGDDRAFGIAKADSGYFVVGSSTSFIANQTVAWIIKIGEDGAAVWNRTYTENAGMEFRAITATQSGFFVVGNTFLASGVQGVVMKLDQEGNPQWNATISVCDGLNKLFSGAADGNAFVAAGLAKPQNASTSHGWLVKLDADGNVAWSKIFGDISADTALRGVTVTNQGDYVSAGYTNSSSTENYDFFAVDVNSAGTLLSNRTYGGSGSDMAYSVTAAPDGAVIAGNTYSLGAGDSDVWIMKIDQAGKCLWAKSVGGKDYDSPSYITAAPDGGYLVTGTTFSFGNGNRDFWLFKVDDQGRIVWSCTVGRSGYEEAYGLVTVGKEYVLAGWTNSIGAGGRYDFYVAKVKAGN